jgi:hypothetical protein
MSIIDKVVSAVTPPESDEARAKARAKAEAVAKPGEWLALILDHHREIEARFADLKAATSAEAKRAAQKELALILTAHSLAEEVAVYPALAADKQLAHAELAYQEQSAAKMEMGLLERLVPSSEDYADKVEHIRAAVAHHVYSEEGTWFTELAENLGPSDQALITRRYKEEFDRYVSGIA